LRCAWADPAVGNHRDDGTDGRNLARSNIVLISRELLDFLQQPYKNFHDPHLVELPLTNIKAIQVRAAESFDPRGQLIHAEEWERRKYDWLPSAADTEYLLSIMATPVYEPGKFANYIAPPRRGVNHQPIDFEYVRTEQ
jgi:hypothetical protein